MIFDRTKFYCKNGEIVYVSSIPDDSSKIHVLYKGNCYLRPKSAIGTTLFFDDPTKKQWGSSVPKNPNKRKNVKNKPVVKKKVNVDNSATKENNRYVEYKNAGSVRPPKKQCSNCQDYVGGRCPGYKAICEDYRYAPTVKEEWPDHMGYFIPYNKK